MYKIDKLRETDPTKSRAVFRKMAEAHLRKGLIWRLLSRMKVPKRID
jgi:hypothetical protein